MASPSSASAAASGPLAGVRIVELAGKGPAPLCGMLLADMGADVIRIERASSAGELAEAEKAFDILHRNRRSIVLDLKSKAGLEVALRLVATADGLIEGFRPGVMERMGLGPDACLQARPSLVYGRVTGWGQTGPLAARAGHDINYLALSGALHAIGPQGGAPVPPLNLVADYGGGAMYLAFGLVCALLEARTSGRGQVIDVAMTDAVASLMTAIQGLDNAGMWQRERGTNLLDGGAPFYGVYETKDGRHMAVGPIEPQFHAQLLEILGLPSEAMASRFDKTQWPDRRLQMEAAFRTRTMQEWTQAFEGSDACVSPVLSMGEAPLHPHHQARSTYVPCGDGWQAAPAPRFSRTPGRINAATGSAGGQGPALLKELGYQESDIERLSREGVMSCI